MKIMEVVIKARAVLLLVAVIALAYGFSINDLFTMVIGVVYASLYAVLVSIVIMYRE